MCLAERIGYIHMVSHAARHRWYYYPDLSPSEVRRAGRLAFACVHHGWPSSSYPLTLLLSTPQAVLFKNYDAADDGSVPRFVPHTAVRHPNADQLPPRESIEFRVFVFQKTG